MPAVVTPSTTGLPTKYTLALPTAKSPSQMSGAELGAVLAPYPPVDRWGMVFTVSNASELCTHQDKSADRVMVVRVSEQPKLQHQ